MKRISLDFLAIQLQPHTAVHYPLPVLPFHQIHLCNLYPHHNASLFGCTRHCHTLFHLPDTEWELGSRLHLSDPCSHGLHHNAGSKRHTDHFYTEIPVARILFELQAESDLVLSFQETRFLNLTVITIECRVICFSIGYQPTPAPMDLAITYIYSVFSSFLACKSCKVGKFIAFTALKEV